MSRKRTRLVPLTEEQRKLVADNHNLIYGYANLHGLQIDDINRIKDNYSSHEDWYGALATGLCYAAQSWDKTKGAFSNWAYINMDSEVRAVKRGYIIHNPKITDSLENIEYMSRGDNKNKVADSSMDAYCYDRGADATYATDERLDSAETRMLIEEEYKKMGKWEKLCRGALEGDTEISVLAKELGLTRQRGWTKYTQDFLPKLRKKLGEALDI